MINQDIALFIILYIIMTPKYYFLQFMFMFYSYFIIILLNFVSKIFLTFTF